MESVYSTLAARALQKHQSLQLQNGTNNTTHPQQQRTLIALAGPPGSGKTTVAAAVAQRLNAQLQLQSQSSSSSSGSSSAAIVLPMDGFHLPRSALDALPNRAEAHARRGASWTFDANGVVDLVKRLHRSKSGGGVVPAEVILAPGFDHKLKDPSVDAIAITPDVSIVILEGNWLLLDEWPWCQISGLVDETWFVDVEPGLARERIARRHLRSGIEGNWRDAVARAEKNDLKNGEVVRRKLVEPMVRVWSVDEPEDKNVVMGSPRSPRKTRAYA